MGLYPHILIGDRRLLTHSLSLSFLLPHSPPARAHLSSGACQTMGRFAMGGPKYKCHFARHLALATPVALVSLPSSPFLSLTTSLFHDDDSKCVSRSATRLVLSPSHSPHSLAIPLPSTLLRYGGRLPVAHRPSIHRLAVPRSTRALCLVALSHGTHRHCQCLIDVLTLTTAPHRCPCCRCLASRASRPPPLPVSARRPDVDDGAPPLPLLPVSRLSLMAPTAIASVC